MHLDVWWYREPEVTHPSACIILVFDWYFILMAMLVLQLQCCVVMLW
jgi:hypothetical protein